MIKELQDIAELMAQCPDHVQRNAAQALSNELQQHEEWVSCGCPDSATWTKMQMQRVADRLKEPPKRSRFVVLWEKHNGKLPE